MTQGNRADFFGGGNASAGPLFERPARIPMSDEEHRVAKILERAKGRANAVARKEIERLTGFPERTVKKAVEGLRKDHGWLVGALRVEGGGYFLVVDEEDLKVAFGPYLAQAIDMIRYAKKRVPEAMWKELAGQLRLEIEG